MITARSDCPIKYKVFNLSVASYMGATVRTHYYLCSFTFDLTHSEKYKILFFTDAWNLIATCLHAFIKEDVGGLGLHSLCIRYFKWAKV